MPGITTWITVDLLLQLNYGFVYTVYPNKGSLAKSLQNIYIVKNNKYTYKYNIISSQTLHTN